MRHGCREALGESIVPALVREAMDETLDVAWEQKGR